MKAIKPSEIVGALALSGPLAASGFVSLLFSRSLSYSIFIVAIGLLVLTLAKPDFVAPLRTYWARPLGMIATSISNVLVFVFFCLFIVPIGITSKLMVRDRAASFGRKKTSSNWTFDSSRTTHGS